MRKTFRKPVQAYIFVAVHAKTFQLHNTSILISVHQVTGLLEGRLRGIVRLSVSGHDEVCACVCLVGVEYVTDFGDAKRKKKKKRKAGWRAIRVRSLATKITTTNLQLKEKKFPETSNATGLYTPLDCHKIYKSRRKEKIAGMFLGLPLIASGGAGGGA